MVRAKLRRLLSHGGPHRVVLFNAGSIMSTNVVNMGLGVVYWWLAARWFKPSSLGFASAAISAMNLLGTLAMLGLGTMLMGELPRRRDHVRPLVGAALLTAGLAGLVLGAGFAQLSPWLSQGLSPLADNPGTVLLFAMGVGLTAQALVFDQAVIGLLRGSLQLWRNVVLGVTKLIALIVAGLWLVHGGLELFDTWLVGLVLCMIAAVVVSGGLRGFERPRFSALRGFGLQALGHHVLNVALQANSLALPLIVSVVLSTTANAYYNIAGMVSTFVYLAPSALSTVLYAVGSADPSALAQRVRFTLTVSLCLTIGASVALVFAARPILSIFGPNYADQGAVPLVLLSFGAVPLTIREHYAAIQRLRGRPVGATPVILAGSALKLVFAAKGASMAGLTGLGAGLLVASCIEALVLVMPVVRVARGPRPSQGPAWDAGHKPGAAEGRPYQA